MNWLALQSDFQVSNPGVTRTQWAIGIFGLLLMASVILIIRHRSTYWGLGDDQRATRADIRLALVERVPTLLQIHTYRYRDEGYVGPEDSLRAALDARFDAAEAGDGSVGRYSTRQLGGRVRQSIGAAWNERVASVPGAALVALRWAVLVTVFGIIAVSTGWLVSLLSADPGTPQPGEYWSTVTDWLATAADTFIATLGAFPYADVLWALGLTLVIRTAEWLFFHWYVVAGALVATAAAVWWLDRRTPSDLPEQLIGDPGRIAGLVAVVLLLVWGVGTGVAAALGAVTRQGIADGIGFAVAVLTLGLAVAALWAAREERDRLGLSWSAQIRGADRVTVEYLLALRLASILSGVGALLVFAYGFVAVADGQLVQLVDAAVSAEPEVQVAVVIGVLGALGLGALVLREAIPDVRSVLRRLGSQQIARLQVAAVGVPVLAVVATYILLSSFVPIIPGLILSVVVGVGARRVMAWGLRFAHGVDWAALATPPPNPLVTIRQWVVTPHNADGDELDTQYIAEVNGRRLAGPDREQVVDDTVAFVDALSDGETGDRSLSTWYGEFVVDRGIADHGEMREKLDEKIRKRAFGFLRSHGPHVARQRFDHALSEFPDEVVETRLDELSDFIYRDSEVVQLRADPYVGHVDDTPERIQRELQRG